MALRDKSVLHPHRAAGRTLIALGMATLVATALPGAAELRAIAAWNMFALALIGQSWFIILTSSSEQTRARAGSEDPGRALATALAVLSSTVSLFASILLHPSGVVARSAILVAVIAAWVLTHTTFALRYAHLFYRDDASIGGIAFPGDLAPSDFDFAYFAFTIGMCFQVSDTAVTSPEIRRTVLLHAVLSYVYSTVVLALALNVIFSTLKA